MRNYSHGATYSFFLFVCTSLFYAPIVSGFVCPAVAPPTTSSCTTTTTTTHWESSVTGSVVEKPTHTADIKQDLRTLLSTMTGTASEYRAVETAVNQLEAAYQAMQTLDFWNLAQTGTWQLLFSTQLASSQASRPNPNQFRLREVSVGVVPTGTTGTWTTAAVWDYALGDTPSQFTCHGTFRITHDYVVTQGCRVALQVDQDQHTLRLAAGSDVPADVPALVAALHRGLPTELTDASGHAADTTYLDESLRIVRYTGGAALEGVRDIFWRMDDLPFASSKTDKAEAPTDEDTEEEGLF